MSILIGNSLFYFYFLFWHKVCTNVVQVIKIIIRGEPEMKAIVELSIALSALVFVDFLVLTMAFTG